MKEGVIVQVREAENLGDWVLKMFADGFSKNGREVVGKYQGATAKTIKNIKRLIEKAK